MNNRISTSQPSVPVGMVVGNITPHLTDNDIHVASFGGNPSDSIKRHLDACDQCRQAVDLYKLGYQG